MWERLTENELIEQETKIKEALGINRLMEERDEARERIKKCHNIIAIQRSYIDPEEHSVIDEEAIEELNLCDAYGEDRDAARAEVTRLTAENTDLKAQLKTAKLDLEDKTIAFESVKAALKTYIDFFEALNPDEKAFENAMKKMKKKP